MSSLNFQCPYCVSKFIQKHNLKTHIQQKHEENFENILDGHMKLHLHGVKEDVNKKQDDMPGETNVDLSKNMDLSASGILLCPELSLIPRKRIILKIIKYRTVES